jgi:hypothetical protein
MIDIVDRLRFDADRCRAQFSNGIASNIEAGIKEIERLRSVLELCAEQLEGSDHRSDVRAAEQARAALSPESNGDGK